MINIPLQNVNDMPCYNQDIVCYAMAHNRRYEMLFAGAWGFEFREEITGDIVGERIKSRTVLNMNYLKRYHGIDIFRSEVGKEDDFIEILERETNRDNPVMVFVSPYYFTWNEHYKKFENHLPHALLVVGVDREKQCIYCLDNMYHQQNGEVSFEDFLAGNNGKYWIFTCDKEYEKKVDIDEMIQYCLGKLRRNTNEWKDFEDIRRFAGAMKEGFDLKTQIENTHGGIWIEPLIFNISGIHADRLDYARLLDYILEQNNDANLLHVKENMDKIALCWNQIRGMLIKGYYLDDPDKLVKRVISRVEQVADLEEETANILENWQKDLSFVEQNKKLEHVSEKEFARTDIIPIKQHFNNQCFGIYNEKESVAGIEGMRYFFFVNEAALQEDYTLRTMKFNHEPITGRENDSIKCDGQVIEADLNVHDCILLMGYGDLCSFEEEIEVQYEDDSIETIAVQIPDSTIPNPFIKNSMIWNGRCGFIDDIEEHTWEVGMYAKAYELSRKPIKNIKLPVCPNIIILAMSFGTYNM